MVLLHLPCCVCFLSLLGLLSVCVAANDLDLYSKITASIYNRIGYSVHTACAGLRNGDSNAFPVSSASWLRSCLLIAGFQNVQPCGGFLHISRCLILQDRLQGPCKLLHTLAQIVNGL